MLIFDAYLVKHTDSSWPTVAAPKLPLGSYPGSPRLLFVKKAITLISPEVVFFAFRLVFDSDSIKQETGERRRVGLVAW